VGTNAVESYKSSMNGDGLRILDHLPQIIERGAAALSNHMDTGDITTLANPDIVEQIRELVQGRNVGPLKEGPEVIKRFGEEA
jgi:hypothetical protein